MNAATNVLKSARTLIENPDHWTQRVHARYVNGRACGPTDPKAVRWCAIGAVYKARKTTDGIVLGSIPVLAGALGKGEQGSTAVALFNDSHSHKEVLALFDKAIHEASLDGVRD